ncbi:MAG: MAE_28990/MAE_18760 family HEPN-like nuclease [Terriglobales bacterium]
MTLLRHYLDGLDKQDRLLALQSEACGDGREQIKALQDHFRTKNNKARYDYNTIVISLYGYLERFIEDLIGEYLALVSSNVPTFAELPLPIQGNHLALSLELARKADYQRYAGSVRVDDIVARLHACFNTPDKYQLNDQAFAQHSANFRQSVVAATFTQSGIADIGQSLRQAEPFTAFLKEEDPERDMQTYLAGGDDVVFARLNDLANRRNDVAHGTPVDDILSRDLLRSYIGFIEAYASGLALVVYERSLPFMLKRAVALGAAITVIDHRIVCVNLPAGKITVGDTLIAKTQDTSRPYKGGPIKEIEQNHVQVNTIEGGPGVQIGMLIEFGAKNNQEFYFLNAAE